MTVEKALSQVETGIAATLLGADPKTAYRNLAQLIHPDKVDGKLKKRAQEAFAKLSRMYAEVNGKLAASTEKVIGNWIVGEPLAKGDICDLYRARNAKDENQKAVFKLARDARDADLLEEEFVNLGILNGFKDSDNFKKYLPRVVDRVEASGRRANILSQAEESHSLADIIGLYPSGIDFRHCVWVANRALSALGFIHSVGVVHGAVIPEHILLGPVTHSMTLVDWCYSVSAESKRHIPAIVKDRKDLYPPEVSRRMPAHPATDIYMLFSSLAATGTKIPKQFNGLFDWALAASPKSRPDSAWELQDRFLQVARDTYGEPKYIKLEIPVT